MSLPVMIYAMSSMLYQVCLNGCYGHLLLASPTFQTGENHRGHAIFDGLNVVHNAIVFHFTFGFEFGGTMAILWVEECPPTPL